MIEIKNLTKTYGQITALDNLNLKIRKGEVLGFLGPNGAGKSTTMNILTGFLPSTSGTVLVDGYDILENPKEVKKRIGYLPEIPPLYVDMTVKEYLNFICELKDVPLRRRKTHLDEIMYLVKIGDIRGRMIKNLSKGYKQRVGLAQALVGDPSVLILDEPTVGLDPKQIIEIRKLISALGHEHTIILSTHILSEVNSVCSSVAIINKGKLVANGSVNDFSTTSGVVNKFFIHLAGPKAACQNAIEAVPGVRHVDFVRVDRDVSIFLVESAADMDIRRPLFHELSRAGFPILELRPVGRTLEEMFLEIVSKDEPYREDKA